MTYRATSLLVAIAAFCCSAQNTTYQEPYRPQFHFSPARNWTNDPNGLVYFDGEYHLFFQFNPFGDEWGHMSWGHAVSPDLVHWHELPVAIPESDGIMIFTGSTVVDERNSSGFCGGGKPCLVAIYTGHTPKSASGRALQTQNLAYSNDRGRTWTKYTQNPVLDLHMSDFRDPKVIWSKAAKRWVMVVALPDEHKVQFYRSADLRHWELSSDFGPAGGSGGQWECPELFEVPVEGAKGQTRWVLKIGLNPGALQGGSGEQYFVGSFNGSRFVNENPPSVTLWTDYGKDCYCALTFNNLPNTQPPVMMGWMSNWQYAGRIPTSPWRGQMTVPRKLALRREADGLRLVQMPVDALAELRMDAVALRAGSQNLAGDTFDLESTLELGAAQAVGWKFSSDDRDFTLIGYDREKHEIFVDRTHSGNTGFSKDFPARTAAPLNLSGNKLSVRVLVDRSSVEVFADDGRVALTNLIYPPKPVKRVETYSSGGQVGAVEGHLWRLANSWR